MNLDELYIKYHNKIRQYVYRHVHDPELADDLTQDTFERAGIHLKRLHLVDAVPNYRAWLYRIAMNCIRDLARHNKRLEFVSLLVNDKYDELHSRERTSEDLAEDAEVWNTVLQAINSLPAYQRKAIYAYCFSVVARANGGDYTNAARRCNCTVTAFKSRLFRARKALKRNPSIKELSTL